MAGSRSILILGASRGIGLGLAQEFSRLGWRVIASERRRGEALHALEGVEVVTADVTDPGSYAAIDLADRSLDVILVNAGISGAAHQSAAQASVDDVTEVMMANAFGPARAAQHLLPKMKDGGVLAFMSSRMGSIADSSGGYDLYRTSKAAQNVLAKGISEQLAGPRGIAVLSLHPGWVQTRMGGPNATVPVEDSARGLADLIASAIGTGAGYRFIDQTGKVVPF